MTGVQQFKQEFPVSAPTSPSIGQSYRYYPHALNPNQPNLVFPQELNNRSRSVPVPQYDQPYPDSAMNSMNPTPVPSEVNDFGADQEILDMFGVTQVKSELISDYYNENEDNFEMRQNSIVSRSVPSTPLPFHTNRINNLKYHMNNNNNNNNSYKSVPTTPVNGPTQFRYTPPASRDYLINGYAIDKCGSETGVSMVNRGDKGQPSDQFQSTNYLQPEQNAVDYRQESGDSMIESDIFNDMS